MLYPEKNPGNDQKHAERKPRWRVQKWPLPTFIELLVYRRLFVMSHEL